MPPGALDLEGLSARLRAVRIEYGERIDLPQLTAAEFALMLGVMRSRYGRCERGAAEPTASLLLALHEKTGVSLEWLLQGSGSGTAAQRKPTDRRRRR